MCCTRFFSVLRRANYPLPRSFSPRLMPHFVLFLYDALKVTLFCNIYKKFVRFHILPLPFQGVHVAFYLHSYWAKRPEVMSMFMPSSLF